MEVKATAAPGPTDARHLAGLRDRYPGTFLAGVVCTLGRGPMVSGNGWRPCPSPRHGEGDAAARPGDSR
jgi:hypothetical protein